MTTSIARAAFYAFLIWAPIPLGSNRPIFWIINGAAVLTIFLLMFVAGRDALPTQAKRTLALLMIPTALMALWILVQSLPIVPSALHADAWSDFDVGGGTISVNPAAGFSSMVQFITIALAGIIAARISTNRRRSVAVLRAVAASASAVAIWGFIALATGQQQVLFGDAGAGDNLTSFFINRNNAATFLALGLVATLALVMTRLQAHDRRDTALRALADLPRRVGPMLAITVVLGVGLIATGSRAGVLAGTIGAFVTFLVGFKRRAWVPQLAIGAALVVVGLSVLIFGRSSDTLFQRLEQMEFSDEARWPVYRDTVQAILDRPVLGHGAGTFPDFFPLYHSAEVPSTGIWLQAHNTYLQTAAEIGLPAFAAAMLVILLLVVKCFRVARRRAEPAALAAVGATVVVGIHSFFDFSLQLEAVAIIFATLLGSGVAVSSMRASREHNGDSERAQRRYETYGIHPESLP